MRRDSAAVRKPVEKRAKEHAAALAVASRAYCAFCADPVNLRRWASWRLEIVLAEAGGRGFRQHERDEFLDLAEAIFVRLGPRLAHAAANVPASEWLSCRDWATAHTPDAPLPRVLDKLGRPLEDAFIAHLRRWGLAYEQHHNPLDPAG